MYSYFTYTNLFPAVFSTKPVRAATQTQPPSHGLPLVQSRPDGKQRARSGESRAHKVQLRPRVNQLLGALVVLGLYVSQRQGIHLLEQLIVDGLQERDGKGNDGREDQSGGDVEFEGTRRGILCRVLARAALERRNQDVRL